MTYTTNPKINTAADYYKRENTVPVMVKLLMSNFNLNGEKNYISRDLLFKYASASMDMSNDLRSVRYINPDGTMGDYCLFKAFDLTMKALRDAGCLIDKIGKIGYYTINESIYRFFKEKGDSAFDSVIENFNNKTYKNLPKDYVESTPKKTKVVLIKRAC